MQKSPPSASQLVNLSSFSYSSLKLNWQWQWQCVYCLGFLTGRVWPILFRSFSFIMACLLSLFLYKNVTTNDFINLFTWCPVHNMKNTTNRWAAFVALCKCVSYYRQAVILNACMHCTATSVAVDTRSVYLSTAHDHGTFLAIWLRSMAIFTTGQQVRRRTWPMTRS